MRFDCMQHSRGHLLRIIVMQSLDTWAFVKYSLESPPSETVTLTLLLNLECKQFI
jgi:hypothetical protein